MLVKIGFVLDWPAVEALQIFCFDRGEYLIAPFHLVDAPAECEWNEFGIVHDRGDQMRKRTVHRQFHEFRVHQNQAQIIRREFGEQTHDQRIHADAFSASG